MTMDIEGMVIFSSSLTSLLALTKTRNRVCLAWKTNRVIISFTQHESSYKWLWSLFLLYVTMLHVYLPLRQLRGTSAWGFCILGLGEKSKYVYRRIFEHPLLVVLVH